jgi:hypothetical protein
MAPTQQPESQLGALQIHAQEFDREPWLLLGCLHGAVDLGDLAARLVDGLSVDFERHATESVRARREHSTQFSCGGVPLAGAQ